MSYVFLKNTYKSSLIFVIFFYTVSIYTQFWAMIIEQSDQNENFLYHYHLVFSNITPLKLISF